MEGKQEGVTLHSCHLQVLLLLLLQQLLSTEGGSIPHNCTRVQRAHGLLLGDGVLDLHDHLHKELDDLLLVAGILRPAEQVVVRRGAVERVGGSGGNAGTESQSKLAARNIASDGA